MLRFLQFSDIHFLYCEETEDDYIQMRTRFLEDMKMLQTKDEGIRYILICGDIASKGMKEEYEKAKEFIDNLCNEAKREDKEPSVFVIPGNHDKNREVYTETRRVLNTELLNAISNDNFLKHIKHNEPETLQILYSPFDEYNSFALGFQSTDSIAETILSEVDKLNFEKKNFFWKERLGLLGNYTVNLIGLNSVLTSDKNDFNVNSGEGHQLYLPKVAYNVISHFNDINIVMMHHPLNCILNESSIAREFDDRFKVQFYGHLHEQSSTDGKIIKIFSGAFQPESKNITHEGNSYFPVYNIIDMDVIDNTLTVQLHSRKWSGSNFVEYTAESKTLSVLLHPPEMWSPEVKAEAKREFEEINKTMIPKHEIKYLFLNSSDKRAIMDALLPEFYDSKKSERANYILFLKEVEKQDLFIKLLDQLNSK